MGRLILVCILLPGLLLSAASCANLGQPSPKIEYYSLEYDPPRVQDMSPLPLVIKVERFSVAPQYLTNRIIYRDKPFKREAYEYHRWRSSPADLVTHFLARDLKESGLFRAVLLHGSAQNPGYVIEGGVDEFLESDQEDAWEALLTFSVTLLAADEPDISRRVLFQKTYQGKRPCRQRNPRAVAEAMSGVMADLSAAVIRDVHNALRKVKN